MTRHLHQYYIAVILLLATAGAARAQPVAADTSIAGLYSLLARIDAHPAIASRLAAVEAARRRIAQKSALANPMLMLGVLNFPTNSFRFSEDPMTAKMIGASQDIPWPGKLKTQGEIAAQDTVTTEDDLDEERNLLARDAKLAYFDIYHIQRIIAVYDYHREAYDALIRLAESKLPEEKATQSQILDLQLERADIEDEIIEDKTRLRESQADLEQATGARDTIPITPRLGLPPFSYSLAALDSIARENNPRLRKLRAQAEQDELRYRRADLDKYPDFEFSLEYMQRDALSATSPMNPMNYPGEVAMLSMTPTPMPQSDMISAGVSIELPLNYNNQRVEALGEAEARRMMKQSDEQAEELDLHTALEADLAKLRGFRKEYEVLRNEIFPASKEAVQTNTAQYTFDKTTLDAAVRAQLDLLHREHDRYKLEAEYNKTIADMEFLTGKTLVKYTSINDWK